MSILFLWRWELGCVEQNAWINFTDYAWPVWEPFDQLAEAPCNNIAYSSGKMRYHKRHYDCVLMFWL